MFLITNYSRKLCASGGILRFDRLIPCFAKRELLTEPRRCPRSVAFRAIAKSYWGSIVSTEYLPGPEDLFDRNRVCASMKLRPLVLLIPILLLALCPSNKLNAQTTASGGLAGVVTDPSGAVVPDASVEIKDNAKGTTQATKTDREGLYGFSLLTPARYILTVRRDGFRKEIRPVTVPLGPPVTVNVVLEIAKENSTVKVTGESPLI